MRNNISIIEKVGNLLHSRSAHWKGDARNSFFHIHPDRIGGLADVPSAVAFYHSVDDKERMGHNDVTTR